MKSHTITYLLFGWLVLGSALLFYFQHIDGTLVRKPFVMSVDPMKMQTDKAVYHRGEMVSILTSVCKYRDYYAKTTWRMVNQTVVTFPDTGTRLSSVGCFENKWIPIAMVPMYAVDGGHHLEGTSAVTVNALRTIYYQFRSVEFEVK